jgi:putative membrane protein
MSHEGDLRLTTATQRIRPDFRNNRLLQILLVWYVILWVLLAIRPLYRQDWFLENILVIPFFILLVTTYRVFPLSNMSYLLITLFMSLHAVGAHYTYAEVPFGFWLKGVFSFSRNHFDRIVHFAFGLLMAYPARELFFRIAHSRGFWAYYLPIAMVLAFSGMFEVVEMIAALIVSPELGDAYLGTQGDIWDAQKDMLAATMGAVIAMAMTSVFRNIFKRKRKDL